VQVVALPMAIGNGWPDRSVQRKYGVAESGRIIDEVENSRRFPVVYLINVVAAYM
jgi:hypothetical protein